MPSLGPKLARSTRYSDLGRILGAQMEPLGEQPLSLLCPVPFQGHCQGWLRPQQGLNPPPTSPREL